MAKILQSQNFIKYVISVFNEINYTKNGGAYMKNMKIFQEGKQNLFDDLMVFLKSQEVSEKENSGIELKQEQEIENKNKEAQKNFEKEILNTKLLSALNSFDILTAEKIKETLNNLESKNHAHNEHENKTCCDEEMLQCCDEQSSTMED